LSRRTIRGPVIGFFHTAVCTVLLWQVTSRGIPTLTDSTAPDRCPEVTSSPSHATGQPDRTTPSSAAIYAADAILDYREPQHPDCRTADQRTGQGLRRRVRPPQA
jgi:hypothetical protein